MIASLGRVKKGTVEIAAGRGWYPIGGTANAKFLRFLTPVPEMSKEKEVVCLQDRLSNSRKIMLESLEAG